MTSSKAVEAASTELKAPEGPPEGSGMPLTRSGIARWLSHEKDVWAILSDEAGLIRRKVRAAYAVADLAAPGPYAADWRAWAKEVDSVAVRLLLDLDPDALERG